MDEIKDKKQIKNPHCLGAVNSLLESIVDRDESFRNAIENSLNRIIETYPNDTINVLCDYRLKNPKLPEQQVAIVLRTLERYASISSHKIADENLIKIIDLCISEIVRTQDSNALIQNPAVECLVAIGRVNCDKVMDSLTKQLQNGHVAHFMVLNCMGTLATANISGIYTFIKPTLETILPNLGLVKLDHVKQAYAFGIGRFAEAITEHVLQTPQNEKIIDDHFHAEIAIAYEVFIHQWLPNREPKVSAEILQALSHMYPLLALEKIAEQSIKVIPHVFTFYRRSMDRNAITQLLSSILKTTIETNPKSLDQLSDQIISNLFDLVCVNPDYEKPQTVKGHYEVLRCYDLLVEIYAEKVFELLLIQLRSNNERDRIKALLVVTHLTNTFDYLLSPNMSDFMPVLKHMMHTEKTFKVKMVLLKTIVGLAQRDVVTDAEFIRFMLRNSLKLVKITTEFGTADEHEDFIDACSNSLYLLASTVRTIDILMKQVLLEYYMMLEYTGIVGNIARCLANLFLKSTDPIFMVLDDLNDLTDGNSTSSSQSTTQQTNIPSPESVFVRSIILLGNNNEAKRNEHILSFLRYYSPLINKKLPNVWKDKIPELITLLGRDGYLEQLYALLMLTIKSNEIDGNFSETLAMKIADQLVLYPMVLPASDYTIPKFTHERGMLLKLLGLALCYVTDVQTIEAKIDLILTAARQEKVDKQLPHSHLKLTDACQSLGFVGQIHWIHVLKKLTALIHDDSGSRKTSGIFFGGLNFIKDSGRDNELYKITMLIIDAYAQIVQTAPQSQILQDVDGKFVNFLYRQLVDAKDYTMRKHTLSTLLTISKQIVQAKDSIGCSDLKSKSILLQQILKIDFTTENLPLLPMCAKLATNLLSIESKDANTNNAENDDMADYDACCFFDKLCRKFFTIAQQLKSKFETIEEDDRNSYLAKHLNLTLPEMNALVKVVFDRNASPSTLDDVNTVLEFWIRDGNSEVRICASHVMNNALEIYTKSVKIGYEAPSKFNQTGSMLARIVPRCIDSNATVRQTSIEIVQKILGISCIYESLTIADESVNWVQDLQKIGDEIITDDPKEIYRLASEIARIIAERLSSLQYLQFSKTLLYSLNDVEQSSAIGASVVLKFFLQIKGSELFHAIPDYVKDALMAIGSCPNVRARTGVLKALVALTKHHPKLVCSEMLGQQLPYDGHVIEFWKIVAADTELSDVILDNFLATISSSCLYEPSSSDNSDHPQIVTAHPFAIFCALHEMLPCKEIQSILKSKFPDIFCTLLTTMAVYTNLAPPAIGPKSSATNHSKSSSSSKSKFGFVPNKDAVKMQPCLIVMETLQSLLDNLEMEQISAVLSVCPSLATSVNLNNFMEILTPFAVSFINQFGINSTYLRQIITTLSRYVASPYDPQRITAVGLYSQLVPLKPSGEMASIIMLHLNTALSDPNPLVRGFCIRGFSYIGHLTDHDIHKYSETSLSALMKGIDDLNPLCFINIPLESIRGLSRVLSTLSTDKFENFQISVAIRIRPFYENPMADIREAAILLLGDLCECASSKNNMVDSVTSPISEALKEQLFGNLFSMLLHLSETNGQIVKACKITLRKLTIILDTAPKLNTMIQSHLLDHGHLNYDLFIVSLLKIVAEELPDHITDFIESCLPFLKSSWPEIRGNAVIIIGILHNSNRQNLTQSGAIVSDGVGQKVAILLKDEQLTVRIKAANALGYMFGTI